MLGTIVDAYYRGYDVILVEDAVATTSPAGGLENVVHNIGNVRRSIYVISLLLPKICSPQSYGFVTDSSRIVEAVKESEKRLALLPI